MRLGLRIGLYAVVCAACVMVGTAVAVPIYSEPCISTPCTGTYSNGTYNPVPDPPDMPNGNVECTLSSGGVPTCMGRDQTNCSYRTYGLAVCRGTGIGGLKRYVYFYMC